MGKPDIYLLDNLAPEELHAAVWRECSGANWQFGHGSTSAEASVPFWYMSLNDSDPVDKLWAHARPKCEELTGLKLAVNRQYANGHTYGQGGQPHRDDVQAGTYTLLYFPMLEWQPRWEGETNYFDEHGQVIGVVQPVPNRGVLFDSRIMHFGRAPSRFFAGLRVTVAFKLQELPDAQ